jgi:hypothetical protein
MKKLLVLVAAALSLSATAAVGADAPTLSLTLSPTRVIFGGISTVNGAVTPAAANQTVSVTEEPQGEPMRTIQVKTDADGKFSLKLQPRIQTVVTAHYQNQASNQTVAFVRPRIGLRKNGVGRFAVSVVAAHSLAGRYVWLTRYSAKTRGWVRVKRIVLAKNARTEGVSVASFRLRVRRGTKLRVQMTPDQARPGYLGGQSNFIVV